MLTKQQVYDKVKKHLLAQGKRAARTVGAKQECMYRTEDGLMCAAGCLIDDEHYTPIVEGRSCLNGYVLGVLVASGVEESDCHGIVRDLQKVHDFVGVHNWGESLRAVARTYGLVE